MSSMAAALAALENLTLNATEEIHVKASLEVTLEAWGSFATGGKNQ
jgi:uncharacterized protein (DUF2345 family)